MTRFVQNVEAKQAIGLASCDLIEEGEAIFLDCGTTTHHVAQHLATRGLHLTVLTNSPSISECLADAGGITHSSTDYSRLTTLKAFSERILAASGRNLNIEMVPRLTEVGGNGPILAYALAHFDIPVSYIGCLFWLCPAMVCALIARLQKCGGASFDCDGRKLQQSVDGIFPNNESDSHGRHTC
jgi:hypothetical protein